MFLLHKNRNKNIIAAHVNYHYRGNESNLDQELVEKYCLSENIILEILNVDEIINEKYINIKNKQSKARKIRYDFFYKIADKYEAKEILIAHHRDDFLETAIMQKKRDEKSNNKLFYGLEKTTKSNLFIIKRPLLKYWKNDILNLNHKKDVPFRLDKSNFDPIYERNKIRIFLLQYNQAKKEEILENYESINKSKKLERKKVFSKYHDWGISFYSLDFYKEIQEIDLRKKILFLFINSKGEQIKLSSGKMENIDLFLNSKKNINKEYKLKDNLFLVKKKDKLSLEERTREEVC